MDLVSDTQPSMDLDAISGVDVTGSNVSLDLNSSLDAVSDSGKKAPTSPIPVLNLGEPLMPNSATANSGDFLVMDTSKQTPLQVYPTTQTQPVNTLSTPLGNQPVMAAPTPAPAPLSLAHAPSSVQFSLQSLPSLNLPPSFQSEVQLDGDFGGGNDPPISLMSEVSGAPDNQGKKLDNKELLE